MFLGKIWKYIPVTCILITPDYMKQQNMTALNLLSEVAQYISLSDMEA